MKSTKKIVAAMLSGSLAFTSIAAAPMVAYADEAATQDASENVYLNIVNGDVNNMVDQDGNPILESAAIYQGPVNRYGSSMRRYASNYVDNSVGSFKNAWKGQRWNVYAPVGGYVYTPGLVNDYYYYNGNLTYPRYASDYSLYNGQMSYDTYRQYAIESVLAVQSNSKYANIRYEDKLDVEASLAIIRSSTSISVIQTELEEVRVIANRHGIPMTTNWYLPYDYDYRWNWRNYDYRWDWRPYERDRKSSDSETRYETKKVSVYRLLNPTNGDHVYNASASTRKNLLDEGWTSEGNAWNALETSSKPVYQLRNTVTGRHHFTVSSSERDGLVGSGWVDEGVAFYASESGGTKVYRVLNPKNGSHFFTKSSGERDGLVRDGWTDEGVAFYVAK